MMRPNLALIGCGAIAQAFYLPAIAKHRARFGDVWLVDPSDAALARASALLAARHAHRLEDVPGDLHLVIAATPNQLHYPLALAALARGAHVLIEKPFVIFPAEGHDLIAAAASANNRVLAVNQTRRLHPIAADLRRRIGAGEFGALQSIVHPEGTKLAWPFESGAGFARGAVRTGVIMDFGVHVIDFYHHLLQPSWSFVSATHDGFSGPEGLAEIELKANGAPVCIRLSRYYQQANVARVTFELAEVSFGVYDDATYSVRPRSRASAAPTTVRVSKDQLTTPERLLLNLLAACEGREPAVCDAASSLPVIDLLDQVYRGATPYSPSLGAA